MTRRLLLLALSLGLLTTSLASRPTAAMDCEECASYCNTIPMDPNDCRDLYCPGCATVGTVTGIHPVG
jgi:hypothetical protein